MEAFDTVNLWEVCFLNYEYEVSSFFTERYADKSPREPKNKLFPACKTRW